MVPNIHLCALAGTASGLGLWELLTGASYTASQHGVWVSQDLNLSSWLCLKMMLETQPLQTSAKSNLGDRVLGKVEKNSFIACIALLDKGDMVGLCLKNCVSTKWGFGDSLWQWFKEGGVANKIRVCAEPGHTTLDSGGLLIGGVSPAEELRGVVMCVPWGATRTISQGCIIAFGCSSLVSASPPFSDLQLFESLLCPELPHGPAWFQGEPGLETFAQVWGPFLIQPWKSSESQVCPIVVTWES